VPRGWGNSRGMFYYAHRAFWNGTPCPWLGRPTFLQKNLAVTYCYSEACKVELGGFEPPDLLNAIQPGMNSNSITNQALTAALPTACTSEAETANAGTVEALALMLQRLPEGDKVRLAALLAGTPKANSEGNER
jgi:hypothetical protein